MLFKTFLRVNLNRRIAFIKLPTLFTNCKQTSLKKLDKKETDVLVKSQTCYIPIYTYLIAVFGEWEKKQKKENNNNNNNSIVLLAQ